LTTVVSSTSMKVANITANAMSQGLTTFCVTRLCGVRPPVFTCEIVEGV
jgi:hypothetical protein